MEHLCHLQTTWVLNPRSASVVDLALTLLWRSHLTAEGRPGTWVDSVAVSPVSVKLSSPSASFASLMFIDVRRFSAFLCVLPPSVLPWSRSQFKRLDPLWILEMSQMMLTLLHELHALCALCFGPLSPVSDLFRMQCPRLWQCRRPLPCRPKTGVAKTWPSGGSAGPREVPGGSPVPQEVRYLPRKGRILPEQLSQRPGYQNCKQLPFYVRLILGEKLKKPSTWSSCRIPFYWVQNGLLNWPTCCQAGSHWQITKVCFSILVNLPWCHGI